MAGIAAFVPPVAAVVGVGGFGSGSGGSSGPSGGGAGGGGAGGASARRKNGQWQVFGSSTHAANIKDTPVSYSPPIGRRMDMHVNFSDDEIDQPGTFTFTNFGSNWTFNWLSYLTIDPGTSAATIRIPSGGTDYEALVSRCIPARQNRSSSANKSKQRRLSSHAS